MDQRSKNSQPCKRLMDESVNKVEEIESGESSSAESSSSSSASLKRQKKLNRKSEEGQLAAEPASLPTKVVLRYLPPTMTEQDFMEFISPLPEIDSASNFQYYINFDPVDPDDDEVDDYDMDEPAAEEDKNREISTATGHVNFSCHDHALNFIYKFNNYVINTLIGDFQVWADFAISQQAPTTFTLPNSNPMEEDSFQHSKDYLKFAAEYESGPGQAGQKPKYGDHREMSKHVLKEISEREATRETLQAPLVTYLLEQKKIKLEKEKKQAAANWKQREEMLSQFRDELIMKNEEIRKAAEDKRKAEEEMAKQMKPVTGKTVEEMMAMVKKMTITAQNRNITITANSSRSEPGVLNLLHQNASQKSFPTTSSMEQSDSFKTVLGSEVADNKRRKNDSSKENIYVGGKKVNRRLEF